MTSLELPEALAGLVGSWRGDGVGASLSGEADFRFGHEVVIAEAGGGRLSYVSRSWALEDDPASAAADTVMTESGFWRWSADGGVELVLSSAAGFVVVLYGEIRPDASGVGAHLEMASDLVGRTSTADSVAAEKRLYSRRGDVLLFAVDQAVDQASGGQGLRARASGALHPAEPGQLPGQG